MSAFAHNSTANPSAVGNATLDRNRPHQALQPTAQTEPPGIANRDISQALELSESRTYDYALEILGAYKLTGCFPIELEIILRELGVIDKITYELEPKSPLSDSRHVLFRPTDNVHEDRFREITRLINARVGFDATLPWWKRLFR
jgi:hypothetical protein